MDLVGPDGLLQQLTKRTGQGKTSRETIRCLKRYIAREIFSLLTPPEPPAPGTAAVT